MDPGLGCRRWASVTGEPAAVVWEVGFAPGLPEVGSEAMKTLREPLQEWLGRCLAPVGFRLPLPAWNQHPLQFLLPMPPRRRPDPAPVSKPRAVRASCA